MKPFTLLTAAALAAVLATPAMALRPPQSPAASVVDTILKREVSARGDKATKEQTKRERKQAKELRKQQHQSEKAMREAQRDGAKDARKRARETADRD
jgi:hypothetical protein